MENKLKEIEQNFLLQILEAQTAYDIANSNLMTLYAQKEEKLQAVRAYYEAVAQKEQAEIVIANTPKEIKL